MLITWLYFLGLLVSCFTNGQGICQPCPSSCQCSSQGGGCVVDCSGNNLKDFPAINQFPLNISQLYLNDNEITKISQSTFSTLSSLSALYLQNNSLSVIEQGAFESLSSLQILNLSTNHLTTVPDDLLFLNLQTVYLSQNLWVCNCTNSRFQNWVRSNPGIISGEVVCDEPHPNTPIIDSTVDLSMCAEAQITCNSTDDEFVLWDFSTDLSSDIENTTTCKRSCFSGGYYYSLLQDGVACLCAYQRSSSKYLSSGDIRRQSCLSSCSTPTPSFACQRRVVSGSFLLSIPQLHFSGNRTYLQNEEVLLHVTDAAGVSEKYMWNFNYSSSYYLRTVDFITHKFASAGTYLVTVMATRGEGMLTSSFPLTIEYEVAGFTLQCPVRSSAGHVNISYTLQRGSAPVLSWMLGHSNLSTENLIEPHNYVSGSAEFDFNHVMTLYDVEAMTRSGSGYSPSQEENIVMLFPGIWFVDGGKLHSWELVLPPYSSPTTLRLQVYRPTCSAPLLLSKPGCQLGSTLTSISTCGSNTCSSDVVDCVPGLQYCYFNKTDGNCRAPLIPCSGYYDNSGTSRLEYADQQPHYDLIHDDYVTIEQNKAGLYQVATDQDTLVEPDDVIAIEFEQKSSVSFPPKLIELPVSCSYSNNSIWRQSALLFSLNTSDPVDLPPQNGGSQAWLHAVWCSIRVHYSKASSGIVKVAIENSTDDNVTYEATVSNQASNQSIECLVQPEEEQLQIILVSPPSEIIDGQHVIYVERNKDTNLSIQIESSSGENIVVVSELTLGRSSSSQDKEYEANCDDVTSSTCSRIVNASLDVDQTGSANINIKATAGSLERNLPVTVMTQERITGVAILPSNVTRVVAGTYQEFTYSTTTGSDITSRWIIDDLTQFSYTRSSLQIIFRTPATYCITIQLSNNLGNESSTHSFEVSDMNPLSIQQIIGSSYIEINTNASFTVEVQVDINMNVTIEWLIDNVVVDQITFNQPQSGAAGATSKQVIVSYSYSTQFATLGNKTLKVVASNDYDVTSQETILSVLPRITGVEITPTSDLITGENVEFQIQVLPSSIGSSFTINWGDTSSDQTIDTTVTHTYSQKGNYRIGITADNNIEQVVNSTDIIIYDRISGLSITSNSPTEVGYDTALTATLSGGNDSFASFEFNCGTSGSSLNSSSPAMTCNYPAAGYYNVTVRAFNPASMEEATVQVQAFDVVVVRVEKEQCYAVNNPGSFQAVTEVSDSRFFNYSWNFGSGSIFVNGVESITYNFTNPGNISASVTLESLLSGRSNTSNFDVCVQSPIESVSFDYNQLAVRTSDFHSFSYLVTGGTDVSVVVDFGDGQTETNNSASGGTLEHTYAQAGNYTATLSASNLVSTRNLSVEVITQDVITILNVTTSSEYGYNVLANELVNYTVTYSGSNASRIMWQFGSSSTNYSGEDGNTVSFTFTNVGPSTLAVEVANLVSSDNQTYNIDVFDPVGNVTITSLPDIVLAGSSVWINVSAPRSKELFWRVSLQSSPDDVWDYQSSIEQSYLHTFTQSGLYNITVKSENEASAEFVFGELLVAEALGSPLLVEGLNLTSGYGAVDEDLQFVVKLENGAALSTSTYGNETFLSYDWDFIKDGSELGTDNETVATYSFSQLGEHIVSVNATNAVSYGVGNLTVDVIERIGNVTVEKTNPPSYAVAVNDTVQLNASLSSGSLVMYNWNPNSSYTGSDPSIFETVYSAVGRNIVTLDLSNPLGTSTSTYEIDVLDPIRNLTIEHTDGIEPFYVPHQRFSTFRADVSSGTDVNYTWLFINQMASSIPDPHSSQNVNTYQWNFTEIAVYTLMLTASNLVSEDILNTTIRVLDPATDLTIITNKKVFQTNQELELNASVITSSGAWFSCDFGDGSSSENSSTIGTTFSARHLYPNDGIYDVLTIAYNNVSRINASEMIIVREVIDGLNITGCNPDEYVRSDLIYNLTANVTSGTAVQYNWTIYYSNGVTESATGSIWSLRMQIAGRAVISLHAENELHYRTKNITIFIQDPPDFSARLTNRGTIYVNDTVEIEIYELEGTDVRYDIDFDDGNTVVNSSLTTFTNVYIDPGVYEVNITAYNQVAQRVNTLLVTVGELECVAPQLTFVVGQTQMMVGIKFFKSRQIYLETNVETFGCTAYSLNHRWHIYSQQNCSDLQDSNIVPIKFSISSSPLLSLPPLTLDVGNYCFKNVASYLATSLSSTISMAVEVLSTPLAVVIKGGTERYVSQSSPLTLDATSSFDPDLAADQQTLLTYSWSCMAKAPNMAQFSPTAGNCFTTRTVGSFQIPAGDLLPQYEYNFTVTASKVGKADVSAWQSVIIESDSIPTAAMTCLSCQQQLSLSISAGHHLTLQASCEHNCRVGDTRYEWVAHRRNSSDQVRTVFPLNSETTTTGNTKRSLVVKASALLLSYCEYDFTLTITSQGLSGSSKLQLQANKPPAGGTCSMSFAGAQVYVLETPVEFSCSGWVDEDLSPLIYTIIAKRYNNNEEVDEFLIYKGTSSSFEAYVPVGFENNKFDISIQIRVEDQLGAYALGLNETLNVKLNDYDEETIKWLRNMTFVQLANLVRSGNPQVVADYAAGLITVLNQESESGGSSTTDPEFSLRTEIRSNITLTITSLATNTFAEVQQVAAVFKECMRVPAELQNVTIFNISLVKLQELIDLMPGYVSATTQSTFLAVTTDLIGIISYLMESINYPVYSGGDSSIFTETYRRQHVESLVSYSEQLTENVLEEMVEGEEALFINASAFSLLAALVTPASLNRSILNDGCYIELPGTIFSHLPSDEQIYFILSVSQLNPYTFGYLSSSLTSSGTASITSRVPSLQFKFSNRTAISVSDLRSANNGMGNPIRMVIAPSERIFIGDEATEQLADLPQSSSYSPRNLVNFELVNIQPRYSVGIQVTNNNRDPQTALYIMVVFDTITSTTREESSPYVDVYFDDEARPNDSRFTSYLRLTESLVSLQADHKKYTIYLDPNTTTTTLPYYYLNISSSFQFYELQVGVGIYYSSCQYFDVLSQGWSTSGLATSEETLPSAAVCTSDHLTSFGSFVLSPPNSIEITDIVNIDFSQNPVALILVSVIFGIYVIALIRSHQLDQRDIKNVSIVPLCGPNLSHKYEVTIKTSPGIGSGTTANVGICVYGYEARTGARHLYKEDAFQRGAVDVFHIACDVSLGTIYKLKLWHDNTGLDPGWNVSRVMVKDLQSDAKYYFLIDSWLQVYPDDVNETCLQKTVRAASDEEMSDFSTRFGTQLSYGWEDAHLWLSLIERPPRSSFTRVQRATCCVTLLYMFILLSAVWYQGANDTGDFGVNLAQDIAVGAIVSILVFPGNLLIVFLFKSAKCKVSPMTSWIHDRAQTAQTVEILDEVLDGRSRKSTLSRMFPFSHFSIGDTTSTLQHFDDKHEEEAHEKESLQLSAKCASEDTGIATGTSSSPSNDSNGLRLRRRNTSYPSHFDDEFDDDYYNELWGPYASDDSLRDEDMGIPRPTNLKRTQKGKFQQKMLTTTEEEVVGLEENDDFYVEVEDGGSVKSYHRDISSPDSSIGEPEVEKFSLRSLTLPPSFPMYVAYFLCFCACALSIFFIIFYGHSFGVEVAKKWVVSMLIALLESVFIIEPIKVLFLAIYLSMFTEQATPEQSDHIVPEPLLQPADHCCRDGETLQKLNKIRPPRGFALEQCKEQAKKSVRARKYVIHFVAYTLLFWSVFAFCMWDRSSMSYWVSNALRHELHDSPVIRNGTSNITFEGIRTDADMWAWLEQVFDPTVTNKAATFYDNGNNFNNLLGQVRLRQQRQLPAERCPASSSSVWGSIAPEFSCITASYFSPDTAPYYPGWSTTFSGNNATWLYSPSTLTGYGYWGNTRVYDDSGYIVYLDPSTTAQQLSSLQGLGWTDRLTRVCFVEFTQYNPATYWFIVSVYMFEFDATGVIQPSQISQTVRLFSPSTAFYLDQLFIIFIALLSVFLWMHEIIKMWRNRESWSRFWKSLNFFNLIINLLITTICILFIYKEVYLEDVMRTYKSSRILFHNFYGAAFISNVILYLSAILLMLLTIKAVKIFRFFRSTSVFEEAFARGFKHIAAITFMLIMIMLAYSLVGYLIFGLNSIRVIRDFQDSQNSFYSMFRVLNRNLDVRPCYEAMPVFTIIFFLSFYFEIFFIFSKLFAAILIKEYKHVCSTLKYPKSRTPEYVIMEYMIDRMKMRLGLVKAKQFRPTVHFEGMSNHSSESSFISLDSLGSCFTPERISQCSDASGISTSDSGLGTPSDHSISLFDYLTLEHPPFERPMDDLHLDYLYDRLSTYSVDMMIHKMDRVNKLGDDVLSIESKLLEVTQNHEQKKILEKESNEIAKAASLNTALDKPGSSSLKQSMSSLNSVPTTGIHVPVSVGSDIRSLLRGPPDRTHPRPPVRSSSYVESSKYREYRKSLLAGPVANSDIKKRPRSDEGVRSLGRKNRSKLDSVIKMKNAW